MGTPTTTIRVKFNQRLVFEKGLNEGVQAKFFQDDRSPEVLAIVYCGVKKHLKSFIAGYKLGRENEAYIQPWREGKRLTKIAADRGDVELVGWKYEWCKETGRWCEEEM